ncbi:MAG: hypothetical protein IT233_10705 [Bacteroidia bacterium]|nr:hypothetical protein [Bacteroidia bacterium]
MNKRKITAILGSLMLLFALNSLGDFRISSSSPSSEKETPCKEGNRLSAYSINAADGILQSSIRINPSNAPVHQILKNNVKFIGFNSSVHASAISPSVYPAYSYGHNNFSRYPFYIAFRRLII